MGIFAPPVKKALAAIALSATVLTAVPVATVPAVATVVDVHGGTWDYGSSVWGVWSRYYQKKNGIAQPFGEVTGFTPDVRSPLPLLGLGLVIPGTTLTRLTITTIVRDERVGCSIAY